CCWMSFFAVPPARRNAALALWGIVFYVTYTGASAIPVMALVLSAAFANRRAVAWLAGATVCGLLAFFQLPGQAHWVMPLGFSYLSFELLHVIIERRRGRIPSVAYLDLLAYAFFLPCRIAGPIRRLPDFTAAVGRARASADHVYAGLLRILIGLAKKLVIA